MMWDVRNIVGHDVPHPQTVEALRIAGCFLLCVGPWDTEYSIICNTYIYINLCICNRL